MFVFGIVADCARTGISQHLTFRAAEAWNSEAKKIDEALDSYWIPSLDQD